MYNPGYLFVFNKQILINKKGSYLTTDNVNVLPIKEKEV